MTRHADLKDLMKATDIYKHVAQLLYFFRDMEIKPTFFFLSVLCSFLSVFFNLLGIRLFVPLLGGLIQNDFSKVGDKLGVVRFLVKKFPEVFGSSSSFFFLLLGMILTSVVMKNLLDYVSSMSVGQQIKKADSKIRQLVFSRYLAFGKLYFDRIHTGTISHTVMNASGGVTGQLRPLQKMLSQIMTLLAYLGVMLWISWPLTLVALIIFPTYHYSTRWLVQRIRGVSQEHEQSEYSLMEKVSNLVSCIPLVKAYKTEEREKELLAAVSQKEIDLAFQLQKKQQLVRPMQDVNTMLALLLMACAMTWLIPHGDSRHISHYLVFFFLARRSMPAFGAVANFRMSLARAEGQLTRLRTILSDEGKFIVEGGGRPFEGLKKGIEFRQLNFSYRGKYPVLDDMNFFIEKGKMTAIVGATGAGKSTLVHLLTRFYDCPPGSILVDDIDIRELTLKSWMDRIAFVSQDPMLFNDTLKANIGYGLERPFTNDELMEVLEKARLSDFFQQLPEGADTLVGERGIQLSGGEKQRVSIARALLKKAEILILDEATSALDSQTEKHIQKAIGELVEQRTAIVIAHRLSTITDADKIVVVERGHMIEEGGLDELIAKKGKFYEYWKAQEVSRPAPLFWKEAFIGKA